MGTIRGRAWKFGDGISTDHIAPGRYFHLRSNLPELAKHVLEDARADFAQEVRPGDLVVAGRNFGQGSSREHAPTIIKLAGVGAVLGHIFSPYLAFRGGKGVATGAGMLLALIPGPVGICAVIFLAVAFGTGIVSLGSLSAGAALPLVTWLWGRGVTPVPPAVHWLTVALALLVFWTHRSNIRRLLQGRENRFRRPWERRS